ncbi:MAG: glycosyl transferase [Proteobacteria bacterium SG_bin5]|nr:glycosyltransferase family 2 protein [Sphingomonas sp.]OQW39939.1 MAG: glycosyl transferase [Proteobacteria bacterium SG_bin5]
MADRNRHPRLSVILPSFNQAAFLPRALASLVAQDFTDWEAIAIDDGSTDDTPALLPAWAEAEPRLSVRRHARNRGLGAALNTGLDAARGEFIAYLPSDDQFFAGHLASLVAALDGAPRARLAISGVRHHYNKQASGRIEGAPIQLVQAMHRAGAERWIERAELTTDDLDAMFWDRLGAPVETGRVTADWVDHPMQRHKAIRAPEGGVNPYRQRYQVREPLVFRSTTGLAIDERARFAPYRAKTYARARDGLKILLVGELAYNPERVLALAERGHTLFGLWTDTPCWFNWVGPQPFGHVEDLPADDWRAALDRVRPDVIYGLLNWQTVPFAHQVLRARGDIPFVWHFKEGPFICIEKGSWPELLDLYLEADGRVYSSAEMRDWFAQADPRLAGGAPELILDGDLPKAEVLRDAPTPRLSDADGEIHTVVPGRPIGLHPETVAELAANGVHLHFYGDFIHDMWRAWIARARGLAGRFLHIHPTVHQEDWVAEFSRYDAGWLHFFQSRNEGDLRRADWDDLNLPARMATLGVCGLPMLQRDNRGHIVATQSLARDRGLGFFFQDMAGLAAQLRDRPAVAAARARVWAQRRDFTFDAHADGLIDLFRASIAARRGRAVAAE